MLPASIAGTTEQAIHGFSFPHRVFVLVINMPTICTCSNVCHHQQNCSCNSTPFQKKREQSSQFNTAPVLADNIHPDPVNRS
jgi:hypothetical protein